MNPYILVLARNPHEASTYIRRANLPRGRWRIAARASSIRGIRQAEVHCLPGFHQRPDRHSILAELRYAKCDWKDVEMPARTEAPPVDQGDGMGEQLTLEDAPLFRLTDADVAELTAIPWTVDARTLEVAYRYNRLRDAAFVDALEAEVDRVAEESGVPAEVITGKAKRRRKCSDCGTLHFKDEPCARVDGVEEAPVGPSPTMFD